MRLVRVGVVLVMAVVPARYCHAQESPDRITDGEEVCRERLAIELGKFAGRQVSCLGACIARRRTDPNADCGLFDGDGYDAATAACVADARKTAAAGVARSCGGAACPECYQPGVDCPTCDPHLDCPAFAALRFDAMTRAVDDAPSLVPCDDARSADGLTARESRCQRAEMRGERHFLAAAVQCLAHCHRSALRSGAPATTCDASRLVSGGLDEATAGCIARARTKLVRTCERRCADTPECQLFGCGDLVPRVEALLVGSDPDVYCTNESCCFEAPFCGDGIVEADERCDPAAAQTGCGTGEFCAYGSCDCRPICGDGLLLSGERCDWGAVPTGCAPGEECDFYCSSCSPICGDGIVLASEECDRAAEPTGCAPNERCSDGCRCVPICGDGVVEAGEPCDPTATPTGCGTGEACVFDCAACAPAFCGDGVVTPPEACDRNVGCLPDERCRDDCGGCEPVCGDGIVHPGEACDPGRLPTGCPDGTLCTTECQCADAPIAVSPVTGAVIPCAGDAFDRWGFAVATGDAIVITADTVDPASAADLCFRWRCTNLDSIPSPVFNLVDESFPCTFPPPFFECPMTAFDVPSDGACQAEVTVCSAACYDPTVARYRLSVTRNGSPAALSLLGDDLPGAFAF